MLRDTKYLLGFVWHADKPGIFLYTLIVILVQVFNSVFPLMLKILIDSVTEQRGLGYMLGTVAVFAAAALVVNSTTVFLSPVNMRISHKLELMFSDIFSRKSAEIDMASYDDPEFYNDLQMAFQMGQSSAMSTFLTIASMAGNFTGFATGVAIAIAIDPAFLILAVFSAVVNILVGNRQNKLNLQYNEEAIPVQRRTEYFKGVLYQRDTAEDFKQYGGLTASLFSALTDALKKRQRMELRFTLKSLKNDIFTVINSIIFSYALPYGYIAVSAFYGRISVADMGALLSNYNIVRSNLASIASMATNMQKTTMYAKHLRKLLEYEPEIETAGGIELEGIESVEFRNVHFRYPTGDKPVLEGISFIINRGEKAALVGVNGAGKTTIARLLLRFYDPQEGCILINGRDIREYDITCLRKQVATVFQNFQSYSLPISQLVSCTDHDHTDLEKVCACLEQVGLLDIIEALPQGVHTEYGKVFDENGVILSGGQLQKLVIARMLYKGSSLVIMDEPSSALDPESEYKLNRDISRAAADRTVLLISHRLSTTRDADNIILLEDGKIAESGIHTELLRRGGRYAHMFTLQASGYTDENDLNNKE